MGRREFSVTMQAIGRAAAAARSTSEVADAALTPLRDALGARSVALRLTPHGVPEVEATAGAEVDHGLLPVDAGLEGVLAARDVPAEWSAAGVTAVVVASLTGAAGDLLATFDHAPEDTEVEALQTAAVLIGAAVGRAQATEALQDLSHRVDNAQRLAQMGDYDWHIASDTNTWSDQLYRIYGHQPQSFNASYERFLSFIHPDDRERIQAVHASAYATGEPYEMVERIIRADGELRYLATNGQVVMDDEGRPVRMRGTCIDITSRVLAEREGARSAARFRSLVDSSPAAILVMDADGRFLQGNVRAHELLRADPVGHRLVDVIGGVTPDGGTLRQAVPATALDGSALRLDLTVARLDHEDEGFFAVFLDDAGPRLEREALSVRMREAQVRRRQALEINDNVVQGLASASYALQGGRPEVAGAMLDATLSAARQMMDDLLEPLDGQDLQPGDLVRSHPSGPVATAVLREVPVLPARPDDVTAPPTAQDDAAQDDATRDDATQAPAVAQGDGAPSRTVLVVDDSADMRMLITALLETAPGFGVVGEAVNGEDAVTKAQALRPDIVLLDLAMPVLDGLQAMPLIRGIVPDATIVVLSGFDGDQMAPAAMAAGADGYIEKGRAVDDLHAALDAAVLRRQPDGTRAGGG